MHNNILAVDDELHMLQLLEQIIRQKTEFSIMITNNALEVPRIRGHDEFDVIITDMRMPGLSGMDILKLVREQNRREEVIIITAFADLEMMREVFLHGACDFIAKPFRKERLIRSIECAIARRQLKDRVDQAERLIHHEPFEAACEEFKKEYIAAMTKRYGDNIETIAEKSGLPLKEVGELLGRAK